jgi:C4-dicarboxylate-specific signal transduction histidine kinase
MISTLIVITGDRVQLQQVILNLLRNASDAMIGVDDRPRRLLIKTEREGGDRVRVTVRDAGVGIERQGMDKLFDAFYTTKSGGMGIGLSVSRSIVERHHVVSGQNRMTDPVRPSRFLSLPGEASSTRHRRWGPRDRQAFSGDQY